jgi:LuxR family maltose regulon positive regulatory protein
MKANLFLIPLDDDRRWYRYHHLFADFLNQRLLEKEPERIPELHRRTSQWFEQNGYIREAVDHALAAEDYTGAAGLIEQIESDLLMQSEFDLLNNWLDAMPDEFVRSRPWLCIVRGWMYLRWNRLDDLEEILRRAETALESEPSPVSEEEGKHVRGQVAAIRSSAALALGNVDQCISYSNQSLELLPDGYFNRGVVFLNLGNAYRLNAEIERSNQALVETRSVAHSAGNHFLEQYAMWLLGVNQAVQGQTHRAERTFRKALDIRQIPGGPRLPTAGHAFIELAKLLLEWNQLEAAMKHVVQGLEIAEPARMMDALLDGYTILARVHLAEGELNAAQDAVGKASQSAAQTPNPDLFAFNNLEDCRIRLWVARSMVDELSDWVDELSAVADDPPFVILRLKNVSLARALIALGLEEPGCCHTCLN